MLESLDMTVDARTCKQWYWALTPINFAVSMLICAMLALILIPAFHGFFGGIVAIALTLSIYWFFLKNRAISINCPHCTQYLASDTPWTCPNCNKNNENLAEHPFVGRCGHCGVDQKAFRCPYKDCQQPIYFTPDHSVPVGFRTGVPLEEPKRVKMDEHEGEVGKRQKGIQITRLDVEQAELDVKLKGLRHSIDGPKVKSIEERYRASIKNEDDAQRLHEAIDRECTDEVEREKRHRIVDDIMRDTL